MGVAVCFILLILVAGHVVAEFSSASRGSVPFVLSSPIQDASHGQEEPIDTSFYSRQLFVYGKSAQLRLVEGKVVVFNFCNALAYEVVKNLALAGVGEITIVEGSQAADDGQCSILGESKTLQEYAQSLNPYVQIRTITGRRASAQDILGRAGSIMICSKDLQTIGRWNHIARKHKMKTTAVTAHGNVGFVFNDFLNDFEILDVEGETFKEVLLSATCSLHKPQNNSSTASAYLLDIESIEEEQLNLGLGDTVEIRLSGATSSLTGVLSSQTEQSYSYSQNGSRIAPRTHLRFIVEDVRSTKRASLRAVVHESNDDELMIALQQTSELITSGNAVVRKVKLPKRIQHEPFALQINRPRFATLNACLSTKQDTALSKVLFAAFKCREVLFAQRHRVQRNDLDAVFALENTLEKWLDAPESKEGDRAASSSVSAVTEDIFRNMIIAELRATGIADPLLPIRKGGQIGTQWLDYVVPRYFASNVCSYDDTNAHGSTVECPATVSILGATAAQEVIKGLSQMYTPVSQFLFVESLDSLHQPITSDSKNHEANRSPAPSSSPAARPSIAAQLLADSMNQRRKIAQMETPVERIYGSEVVRELAQLRVFVVGAGAIGCELLKTFALLGVGTGQKPATNSSLQAEESLWTKHGLSAGGILVTDMDLIEKSNLNRQLLFRERHIGQPKALIAAAQVRSIQPSLRIHGLTHKVSTETEDTIFDEAFWRGADVVVTALDNVVARKYVDRMCLRHKVVLIDSGTLGTKANTQVVIPFLTETYASAASDPPEDALPLCTLKSFPYQTDHCVAWAKHLFETLFDQDIQQLLDYQALLDTTAKGNSNVQSSSWWTTLLQEDRTRLETSLSYLNPVSRSKDHANQSSSSSTSLPSSPTTQQKTTDGTEPWLPHYQWAMQLYRQYFVEDIAQLLRDHPLGSFEEEDDEENGGVGQDGAAETVNRKKTPFWSGARKAPTPLPHVSTHDIWQVEQSLQFQQSRQLAHPTSPAVRTNLQSIQEQLTRIKYLQAMQRDFVASAVFLRGRSLGLFTAEITREEVLRLITSYEESVDTAQEPKTPEHSHSDEETRLLLRQLRLAPQSFEKDDLTQGHVHFVHAAATLRGLNYGILSSSPSSTASATASVSSLSLSTPASTSATEVDEGEDVVGEKVVAMRESSAKLSSDGDPSGRSRDLSTESPTPSSFASTATLRDHDQQQKHLDFWETQRLSGKIMPALATTTSLIAGCVAHEVLKIASERLLQRQRQRQEQPGHQRERLAVANTTETGCDPTVSGSALDTRHRSSKWWQRILPRRRRSSLSTASSLPRSKSASSRDVKAPREARKRSKHQQDQPRKPPSKTRAPSLLQRMWTRLTTTSLSSSRHLRSIQSNRDLHLVEIDDDHGAYEEDEDADQGEVVWDLNGATDITSDGHSQSAASSATGDTIDDNSEADDSASMSIAARHYTAVRDRWLPATSISSSQASEKARVLQRFRNTYVNLALPSLAFTQPVAAEDVSYPAPITAQYSAVTRRTTHGEDEGDAVPAYRDTVGTLWNELHLPAHSLRREGDADEDLSLLKKKERRIAVDKLSLEQLLTFFRDHYHVTVTSITVEDANRRGVPRGGAGGGPREVGRQEAEEDRGDSLLYADFLVDLIDEEDKRRWLHRRVGSLLKELEGDEVAAGEGGAGRGQSEGSDDVTVREELANKADEEEDEEETDPATINDNAEDDEEEATVLQTSKAGQQANSITKTRSVRLQVEGRRTSHLISKRSNVEDEEESEAEEREAEEGEEVSFPVVVVQLSKEQ